MALWQRGEVWWIAFKDPHGRRIRKSTESIHKTEAKEILDKIKTTIREGKYFELRNKQEVQFRDLLKRVHEHEVARQRKSYRTHFVWYSKPLASFFSDKLLSEITPKLVEEYQIHRLETPYRGRTLSKATVNRSLSVLRKVFNLAIRWGLCTENPVTRCEFLPEPPGRVRHLSPSEQEALLANCTGHLRDVVLVALQTGMRKGELVGNLTEPVGLVRGDFDLDNSRIRLTRTKNNKARTIPMTAEVRAILTRLAVGRKDDEPVFRKRNGKPYRGIGTAFTKALADAKISNFHFHDLRHTFATNFMAAGGNIFTLSQILGHSSLKMTMRYSHASPDFNKAEMSRFEQFISSNSTKMAQPAG